MRAVGVLLCLCAAEAFVSKTVPAFSTRATTSRALRGFEHRSLLRSGDLPSTTSCAPPGNQRHSSIRTLRMCKEGKQESSKAQYTDVTVREAVEWTMGRNSEFSYVDVRSPEEHAKPTTPRGCINIPAFEQAVQSTPTEKEDDADEPKRVDYEDLEWRVLPDFIDTVKSQFRLDSKLLIGCRTARSSLACQMLADAGFTEIYNVESQSFMKTRQPVWMDY